ncbi:sigma-70 family RNA polymerase sigma factor [Leptolyngbya iicbica]|uniref:Sigma-70 family RNA polymerase sigma factor n=1 Tax=Lyngbya confervoides BDU141951 TaxID=1574623 RepID=A0A0C1YI81_9CYAN
MQQRTTVVERFSTFIQFAEDRFDRWIRDLRLHQGMKKQLAQGENAAQLDGFWTLYWYKLWHSKGHDRAAAHLSAYLQEPCYWAAQSITQRFTNVPWTLADGFQSSIAYTDRILKGYRPDYGSDLKAYARTAFSNLMRDQLRQQQDIHICSDWGLLRRLSQAQLQRSLEAAGFPKTEPHILVWQCFKAIYIPDPQRTVRTLPPPSLEQFAQMTERYNQLRLQLSPPLPQLEVEALVDHLHAAIQAVRTYLTPAFTSLDQPQFAPDSKPPLADLSCDDTPMDLLLAAEAHAEQQQRIQQIEAVLKAAIAQLSPADHRLLQLYYQQTLTQTAIAQELQIQQYQVSRQLSRVRQRLLGAVARWSQETLHISVDSAVLKSMSDVIHEWLQQHYQLQVEGRDERGV